MAAIYDWRWGGGGRGRRSGDGKVVVLPATVETAMASATSWSLCRAYVICAEPTNCW